MLSLRSYHQTFLLGGQPIPVFLLLLLLQYLVFYTPNFTSSLLLIFRPFWSFIGPYIFLSIFRSHVLRDGFIYCVSARVSQPYNTIGLISVVYSFSFVYFDICIDVIIFLENLERLIPCCYSCLDTFSTITVSSYQWIQILKLWYFFII